MKTKRKRPVLKWRTRKTDWGCNVKSGPFLIQEYNSLVSVRQRLFVDMDGFRIVDYFDNIPVEETKAACERLAQSILRHCAKGARHGK